MKGHPFPFVAALIRHQEPTAVCEEDHRAEFQRTKSSFTLVGIKSHPALPSSGSEPNIWRRPPSGTKKGTILGILMLSYHRNFVSPREDIISVFSQIFYALCLKHLKVLGFFYHTSASVSSRLYFSQLSSPVLGSCSSFRVHTFLQLFDCGARASCLCHIRTLGSISLHLL